MSYRSTSWSPGPTPSPPRSLSRGRTRHRSSSPAYRPRPQRWSSPSRIQEGRRPTRSHASSRSRARSPSRGGKRFRSESFHSDDSQWNPPATKRVRRSRRNGSPSSVRSSPRYGNYNNLPPPFPPANAPTGPSDPRALQYLPPARFTLTERRDDNFTATVAIPSDYYISPLLETHDLRDLLQRGNIIAFRQVEFSYLTMDKIRTDYAFTSQGPVSVKWMRPFIIWEAYPTSVLGWWCRTSRGKGLKALHIQPQDYYKYLGLSTTGDGIGNNSPHEQMKISQRQGKVIPSHVFAPELVSIELTTGWQFWGDVEPQSMWRLDALREVCTNLRTAVLDDYLAGLGLDVDALKDARNQLPLMRPGYERPPRGLPFQQMGEPYTIRAFPRIPTLPYNQVLQRTGARTMVKEKEKTGSTWITGAHGSKIALSVLH